MRRVEGTAHNLGPARPPRALPRRNIQLQLNRESRFVVYVPVEKCQRLPFLDYDFDPEPNGTAANVVEDEFFNKNPNTTYRFSTPQPRWNEIPPDIQYRGDECQIDGVVITPSRREVLLTEFKLCGKPTRLHNPDVNRMERDWAMRKVFKIHISTHQMGLLMQARRITDMQNLHEAGAFGNNPPDPLRFNAGGLAIGTWKPRPTHVEVHYISAKDVKVYFDDAKRRNDLYV